MRFSSDAVPETKTSNRNIHRLKVVWALSLKFERFENTVRFAYKVLFCLSHTVRRRTVRKSEVREMPSLPRGWGDELVRDEQVSSRRVRCLRTVCVRVFVHVSVYMHGFCN